MRVSRIALSGFRNYEWESFTFDPGTNVIRGKNGQGKTNLLEAVFMLTGGKSFRTRFDREIVGFGFSSAASWLYFLFVLAALLLAFLVFGRKEKDPMRQKDKERRRAARRAEKRHRQAQREGLGA